MLRGQRYLDRIDESEAEWVKYKEGAVAAKKAARAAELEAEVWGLSNSASGVTGSTSSATGGAGIGGTGVLAFNPGNSGSMSAEVGGLVGVMTGDVAPGVRRGSALKVRGAAH